MTQAHVRVLAIDVTGETGSIALVKAANVIEEVPLHSPDGFAHVLFGEVDALLSRHGLKPSDIGVYACASGPGSFTGVRVGLTTVKGLAEATGRKVVAVSNLQALASFGTRLLRATVMDARRGQVFGAVYNDSLDLVCEEAVMKLDDWLASLPTGDLELISPGFPVEGVYAPMIQAPPSLAGAIGKIAAAHLDRARDPAEIEANYVRRSDAELFWKDSG
jgi:tRNA threonylcarbamoyladenosine biosynthesis protein TsaB